MFVAQCVWLQAVREQSCVGQCAYVCVVPPNATRSSRFFVPRFLRRGVFVVDARRFWRVGFQWLLVVARRWWPHSTRSRLSARRWVSVAVCRDVG